MSNIVAVKLLLPIAFFGYAIFANIALLRSDVDGPSVDGFLKGAFTAEVDTLYRANLPHREPAVGLVGAARYVLLNEGREGVVAGEKGWLFTREEFRPMVREGALAQDALAWIADVDAQLRQVGSALVVVPLPAKLDVLRNHANADEQARKSANGYEWFLSALASEGIAHVDSRPALAATPDAFFRTDTHWTGAGAAAVAEAVAVSNLITLGETDFADEAQAPVQFIGDLVSFVTSDGLASTVGLPAETVVPYVAQPEEALDASLDLFGDGGPTPLVLVGTSYSANPNWSFVEALKLALAHDVINYAREGQGPVAPMDLFLDQMDPAAPPPVVIWEFPVRYLSDPKLLDAVNEAEVVGDA